MAIHIACTGSRCTEYTIGIEQQLPIRVGGRAVKLGNYVINLVSSDGNAGIDGKRRAKISRTPQSSRTILGDQIAPVDRQQCRGRIGGGGISSVQINSQVPRT